MDIKRILTAVVVAAVVIGVISFIFLTRTPEVPEPVDPPVVEEVPEPEPVDPPVVEEEVEEEVEEIIEE